MRLKMDCEKPRVMPSAGRAMFQKPTSDGVNVR